MSQHYSDPTRANDLYSLPDVEVFYVNIHNTENGGEMLTGWYFWYCFPGCLPDSEPFGPYDTEAEAIAAAQEES
jgi:hypothetical protein